jgi:hypothetical protein
MAIAGWKGHEKEEATQLSSLFLVASAVLLLFAALLQAYVLSFAASGKYSSLHWA